MLIVTYMIAIAAYLTRFRRIIRATEWQLLAIALGFFITSVGLDVVSIPGLNPFIFEDGAKFVGIVMWLTYFVRTGSRWLQPSAENTEIA